MPKQNGRLQKRSYNSYAPIADGGPDSGLSNHDYSTGAIGPQDANQHSHNRESLVKRTGAGVLGSISSWTFPSLSTGMSVRNVEASEPEHKRKLHELVSSTVNDYRESGLAGHHFPRTDTFTHELRVTDSLLPPDQEDTVFRNGATDGI